MVTKEKAPEARYKAFMKLPKARQRVLIAKDVLKQLAEGKVKATRGTYLDLPERVVNKLKDGDDLSKYLDCGTPACAVGSLFKCAVLRADAIKLVDRNNGSVPYEDKYGPLRAQFGTNVFGNSDFNASFHDYLEKQGFFTERQLEWMESTFEHGEWPGLIGYTACLPGEMPPKQRMQEIMRNVVKNNGKFKPEQLRKKYKTKLIKEERYAY